MMKRKQAGMTLIELVIVIIVLGIIAAIAAPRFADVSTKAVEKGALGSIGAFKSALAITVAQKADPNPLWADVEANLDGFDITTTDGTVTVDLDGDATDDVTITGYSNADCGAIHTTAGEGTDPTLSWNDGTTCFNL